MNKVTTAALAGLVAVTATASASMTRWAGFGDASAYISDVQDIWTLPGVVASNKNATYFEFGPSNGTFASSFLNNPNQSSVGANPWGGAHGELGPGVLGIWVNRAQNPAISSAYAALNTPFFATGNLNTGIVPGGPGSLSASDINSTAPAAGRVDLLYGFALNDKLDLGISLSRANRDQKAENVGGVAGRTDSYDANGLGFGLGVEIKELAFFKLLEVGLTGDMDSNTVSYKSNAGEDKIDNSANAYNLRVGGDIAGENGMFGRAELGFNMSSADSKNGTTSATPATGDKEFKYGASAWNLGYAMGKSGDKGMGLLGLMLKGNGSSTESDAANTKGDSGNLSLELTTAGEAKVKEWLTARAGIAANLYQSSSTTLPGASNQEKDSSSNNGKAVISTGLSVNLGQITIDGVLNQDLLYSGPYFTNGVSEVLFSQVSATWGW
jgi:hypothetical protein